MAPPPYASPTAPSPSSRVPAPSPSTPAPFAPAPAPEASPPARILRPLPLSCILPFPPSLPSRLRLAPTLAPIATLQGPPLPSPSPATPPATSSRSRGPGPDSPESPTGAATLANHFISQSAPDIRRKLAKAEDGPQTPIRDLQTQALVAALQPAAGSGPQNPPPGACFKCGQEGHWAKMCPNPQPPSKPCLLCKQRGYWASNCPQASRAPTSRGQGPEHPREISCPPSALELLSFDDD
ncbi:uncharacterized protein LOC133065895 [Dama dama]|uniref:uncharacterized protein LOC133065895 n=1 Tax=Dama dama TaxID=30532 RepID=UPI002A367D83|nr:uncharacterized protein LOC133065895 [Dama dama]